MIHQQSRGLARFLWWFVALLVAGDLVAPLLLGPVEPPVLLHHVEHGLLTAAGGAFGLRLARRQIAGRGMAPGWIIGSVLLSGLAVVMMVPDLYGYVDEHPLAHAALHLGFVSDGWLATYAAERYSRGFGVVWLGMILAMTATAATGFGVQRLG
ncbi:MAG: hypothetical protein M1118_01715 [Chloroflexi bacterium]|nr:hypothetical protein [Chloroflexota bacterium]